MLCNAFNEFFILTHFILIGISFHQVIEKATKFIVFFCLNQKSLAKDPQVLRKFNIFFLVFRSFL